MRRTAQKIGRLPVALACAANSAAVAAQNRRDRLRAARCCDAECRHPSAASQKPRPLPLPQLDVQTRHPAFCESEIAWRPASQFHKEYKVELQRELGHGGHGSVFVAVHNGSGVSRAVKRVQRSNHTADLALQKELQIMQRLRGCPHVVQVIDAFADEQYRYLVMELCYGLDLVDAIFEELAEGDEEPVVDPNKHIPHIAAVFREMIYAVAECHRNHIYHMDIKPENFIHTSCESEGMSGRAKVKLLDFGLAWMDVESERVTHGTQLGCSKYLAPELFKMGTDVKPEAVDIYALGVSLFNLFTGRFPYEFYRMGKPRARPDLSNIPDEEARDLVEKLLCATPSKRPSTAEVLQHPFMKKHANAQVVPLSDLTLKTVKKFFTDESPSALMGRGCACAVASDCPHRARARTVKKGEVLFSQGDTSRAVYFVSNGSFDVIKNGVIVNKIESDTVLGEMGALFNRPRKATVIAAEDTEVFEFKDFGKKLGSTQQRYALKGLQEIALKRHLADTTREFLRNSSLFREASDELLDLIVGGSDRAFFKQGDMVLEEDVEKMALYIVQDGLLEVSRDHGQESALVGPGGLVGETALLFGHRSSGETLKALKPTTAVVLDRAEFALILNEFPKECDSIMKSAEKRWKTLGVTACV
eukprot:TRINITY_DN37656_c0_g1_i1.p1 TRINITY_DN37656_c0_g1~~TRINITY_DN37656_c0_g1_i1.p1  ORF type:complete len:666 (+),score=95.08 TRINITY_DN37656_c0_g1_i1:61-1998(+)